MEKFNSVVCREKVLSFGVDPAFWTEKEQTSLTECMVLAWKENPDWTEEQATAACREQTNEILFEAFKEHFGFLIKEADVYGNWSYHHAFEEFKKIGLLDFLKKINLHVEKGKFFQLFYSDLRELYNIDSCGMEDEFDRLKKNGWTFSLYRADLKKRMRSLRQRKI